MKRRIMVVLNNSNVIKGEWYDVDNNSDPLYHDYSKSTEQDFIEFNKVLNEKHIANHDYSRWYTEQ